MEALAKPEEGFTKNAIFAILYAGLVLQPMVIFSNLYGGIGLGGAVQLITVLLFTQLGPLLGKRLSRHEVLVAFIASGISGAFTQLFSSYGFFLAYIRSNPAYSIGRLLPTWLVPLAGSEAILTRTYLHPDWIPFILVHCISFTLWYIANFVLGLIAFQLYSEVENLPFPAARINAETVVTLSERPSERMRYFTYFLFIGFLYGMLAYGFPVIGRAFLRREMVPLIPVPWLDLNRIVQESLGLVGANFGISTSLGSLASGFVIPFDIGLVAFVSAIVVNLIVNPFLYRNGYLPSLFIGGDISYTWQRSFLDFWVGPSIGLAVALGVIPLVMHSGRLKDAIKSLKGLEKIYKESRLMRVRTLVLLYLASSLGTVVITLLLCPDFTPYAWLTIILSTLLPFILVMASARAMASAGAMVEIPYLFEGVMGALPYDKPDIWFAPLYTSHTVTMGSPSAMWVDYLYMAKYTGTKITSIFKGWFFALPIAWGLGLLFSTAIWLLAPIPSSFYPFTAKTWPVLASYTDLFVSKRFVTMLDPKLIGVGFLLGAILYVVTAFLGHPGALVGIVMTVGVGSFIPPTVTLFLGCMIGKSVGPRLLGKENWGKYRFIIAAGLIAGEGLAAGFAGLINIISSSTLTLPY
ncbi:MAG: OPT/YSL family transporter [Thermoproteota archaeon]